MSGATTSPRNDPAVTFPATTTFPRVSRDVTGFSNVTLCVVVFPKSVTFSRFWMLAKGKLVN
jgi:hypothetical protein